MLRIKFLSDVLSCTRSECIIALVRFAGNRLGAMLGFRKIKGYVNPYEKYGKIIYFLKISKKL
jgi:hypothetical protein